MSDVIGGVLGSSKLHPPYLQFPIPSPLHVLSLTPLCYVYATAPCRRMYVDQDLLDCSLPQDVPKGQGPIDIHGSFGEETRTRLWPLTCLAGLVYYQMSEKPKFCSSPIDLFWRIALVFAPSWPRSKNTTYKTNLHLTCLCT